MQWEFVMCAASLGLIGFLFGFDFSLFPMYVWKVLSYLLIPCFVMRFASKGLIGFSLGFGFSLYFLCWCRKVFSYLLSPILSLYLYTWQYVFWSRRCVYPAHHLEVSFSVVRMHLVTVGCTLSDSSNNLLGGGI